MVHLGIKSIAVQRRGAKSSWFCGYLADVNSDWAELIAVMAGAGVELDANAFGKTWWKDTTIATLVRRAMQLGSLPYSS